MSGWKSTFHAAITAGDDNDSILYTQPAWTKLHPHACFNREHAANDATSRNGRQNSMKIACVYPRLFSQMHGLWAPLGITLLGTILRNAGHEVKLLDGSFDRDLTRIKQEISLFSPDIVAVSCSTDLLQNGEDVLAEAKSNGCITIVGGPHPTIAPLETLKNRDIDFIVIGEGEVTLTELVSTLERDGDLSGVRGIGFRHDETPIITPARGFISNLDSLPIADRELLDTFPRYLDGLALNVSAIRGCPFRCTFCQPTLFNLFGNHVRSRSPENVVYELEFLYRRYRIRDFFFVDDLFTVSKGWLEEFRDALNEAGLTGKVRFSINSRVDLINEEIIRTLKAINTYYLLLGLESGSQKMLDSCKKGTTVQQGMDAVQLARKHGIRTHAYILLGLPGETTESLKATEELLEKLRPDTVHISVATPFIGTVLYDECSNEGNLQHGSYSGHDYLLDESAGNRPIKGLDYREIYETRRRILKSRRWRVMLSSALETLKDTIRERSIKKIIFRARMYREMRHYFG